MWNKFCLLACKLNFHQYERKMFKHRLFNKQFQERHICKICGIEQIQNLKLKKTKNAKFFIKKNT